MKNHRIIKLITIICISFVATFCMPNTSIAQRFGHFGGFKGMGVRSINGGSRAGQHIFHEGRSTHFIPGRFNEGIYHHVFGFHPYFYHPFVPYVWGPYWHPIGFFCTVLATDAVLLTIADHHYYYYNGVYYIPEHDGYTVVAPPIGAVVNYLPAGYVTVKVGDDTYYDYGGAFYISQGGSFRVVPAPIGAIVTEIPDGAIEQNINGMHYLLYNSTYYQPISQNGRDAYEVVQVK